MDILTIHYGGRSTKANPLTKTCQKCGKKPVTLRVGIAELQVSGDTAEVCRWCGMDMIDEAMHRIAELRDDLEDETGWALRPEGSLEKASPGGV